MPLSTVYVDLACRFTAEGFLAGSPVSLDPAGRRIDLEVCDEAACDCGHVGLLYRPFHKGNEYRAAAVCPACGAAMEY